MPIPDSVDDLDSSAANNSPGGSEPIGPNLDSYLRAHAAIIRQVNDEAKAAATTDIQLQKATAFTSAGAAPAFTLAPTPAIDAYAARQRFSVKFHTAGTGSDTLNVSAMGAKSLKQYNSAGSKVAAVVAAGQLADVEYDGVDFVILDQLPGGMAAGSVQVFAASGTLPATVVGGTAIINSAGATTQTLPAASTVSAGKRVEFMSIGSGVATISRAGADTIAVNASAVATLALNAGDTLTLESNGSNGWYAVGGSAQLGYAGAFGSSLTPNGYKQFPGGLIVQWGKTIGSAGGYTNATLPIAFPNSLMLVVGSDVSSVQNTGSFHWNNNANSLTSFQFALINAVPAYTAQTASWFAFGC